MFGFLLRKLPAVILVAFVSSIIAFTLPRLAPGDPAITVAGSDATQEQLAAVREELGLNQPMPVQYIHWLTGALHGDFGQSYVMRRPVSTVIADRLESTLELAGLATIIMIVVGLGLGVLAGTERTPWARAVLDVATTILLATPPFLTGLILILIFGIAFHLLPVSGEVNLSKDPVMGFKFLILPAIALALPQSAMIARLLQTTMNSTRGEDFVDLAKAKGVPRGRIVRKHVLRNSLGPAIVAIGLRIGDLLAGAIIIEAIFARNGLGALAIYAVQSRDYYVLQALILGAVIVAVLIQLLSEILIAALDPRIRLEG